MYRMESCIISSVIHKNQPLDIDNSLFAIRYLDMSVDNVDNFVDSVGKRWGQICVKTTSAC